MRYLLSTCINLISLILVTHTNTHTHTYIYIYIYIYIYYIYIYIYIYIYTIISACSNHTYIDIEQCYGWMSTLIHYSKPMTKYDLKYVLSQGGTALATPLCKDLQEKLWWMAFSINDVDLANSRHSRLNWKWWPYSRPPYIFIYKIPWKAYFASMCEKT